MVYNIHLFISLCATPRGKYYHFMRKRRSTEGRELSRQVQIAFGRQLKAQRHATRPVVSQADLALALGVSRTSISNIENGRHRVFLDQLFAAASALRVSAASLLPDDSAFIPAAPVHTSANTRIDAAQLAELSQVVDAARRKTSGT